MDSSYIDKITIDFLMKNKNLSKIKDKEDNEFRENIQKYQGKLFSLIKKLMGENLTYEEDIPNSLTETYEYFIKEALDYIITKEQTNNLQEELFSVDDIDEYSEEYEENTSNNINVKNIAYEDADKLLFRPTKKVEKIHHTLDKYVKKY